MSEGAPTPADEGHGGGPPGIEALETGRIYRLLGAGTVGVWTGRDVLGIFRDNTNRLVLSTADLWDGVDLATALEALEAWVPTDVPLARVVLDPISGTAVDNAALFRALFRHHPDAAGAFGLLGRTLLAAMAELPETTEPERAFLHTELARLDSPVHETTDTVAGSGTEGEDPAAVDGSPSRADWEEARRAAAVSRGARWLASLPPSFRERFPTTCLEPGCDRAQKFIIHVGGPSSDPEMVLTTITCGAHARKAVREQWDFVSICPCVVCRRTRAKFAPRKAAAPPPGERGPGDED